MEGVAIKYGDIALGAKETFIPMASEKADFVDLGQLQQYNLDFPNYVNPCELYSTPLDGSGIPFPVDAENRNMGYWSEQVSRNDGAFATPIVLTLTADRTFSSQGFTLTFDTDNNIYPNDVNITWFNGSLQIATKDFQIDRAQYFCHNQVSNFDKVIMTFYDLNMGYNRLKLRAIDYGYGTVFYGDELRNVKIIQEIDPISSQIAINTADFTVDAKGDIEYSFQEGQSFEIYFNDNLLMKTFVKSSKRKARLLWDVQSEDYIGLLDSVMYYGDMYKDEQPVSYASDVIQDIMRTAKVPYTLSSDFDNETITGYIPYTTCRDALMQVAFAIGAVVDTSYSDVVNIYKLSDTVQQTITKDRIMQGQNFDADNVVTSVEVVAHKYEEENKEEVKVYSGKPEDNGKDMTIVFPESIHAPYTLSGITLIDIKPNYGTFHVNQPSSIYLYGYKYVETTRTYSQYNPDAQGHAENIMAIQNATLVTEENIDNVLDRCYNYLVKTDTTNMEIVEGVSVTGGEAITYGNVLYGEAVYGERTERIVEYDEPVHVGDLITAETEYLGTKTGRVIQQTYSLIGNIIVKETVMRS